MKLHRFPFNSQNSHLAPKSLPQTLSYGRAKRNFCLMPDKGERFIYFFVLYACLAAIGLVVLLDLLFALCAGIW